MLKHRTLFHWYRGSVKRDPRPQKSQNIASNLLLLITAQVKDAHFMFQGANFLNYNRQKTLVQFYSTSFYKLIDQMLWDRQEVLCMTDDNECPVISNFAKAELHVLQVTSHSLEWRLQNNMRLLGYDRRDCNSTWRENAKNSQSQLILTCCHHLNGTNGNSKVLKSPFE